MFKPGDKLVLKDVHNYMTETLNLNPLDFEQNLVKYLTDIELEIIESDSDIYNYLVRNVNSNDIGPATKDFIHAHFKPKE